MTTNNATIYIFLAVFSSAIIEGEGNVSKKTPFYFFWRKKMAESRFQKKFIDTLKARYPGCYCYKNGKKQGYPDLIFLYKDKWATFECKDSETAIHQPNQDLHVERMNNMSFSSFVFPENKQEVLNELELYLGQ